VGAGERGRERARTGLKVKDPHPPHPPTPTQLQTPHLLFGVPKKITIGKVKMMLRLLLKKCNSSRRVLRVRTCYSVRFVWKIDKGTGRREILVDAKWWWWCVVVCVGGGGRGVTGL
jgi:hypothetical protein